MTPAASIEEPRQLFLHRLRTMLWVESTLAQEILPGLRSRVHAVELRQGLERHQLETEGHVENLRRVFRLLAEPPDAEPSAALLGLKAEHDLVLERLDGEPSDLADLVYADTIARNEHAEIAAYSGLYHLARALGEHEVAALLRENLEQEEHALEQAEHALARLLAETVERA